MADKPIIFSAPMVKALIDGRKTMTRRVLKPQPGLVPDPHDVPAISCGHAIFRDRGGHRHDIRLRYAPGDRLYVREAWSHTGAGVWSISDARRAGRGGVLYRANHEEAAAAGPRVDAKWWPSIHMPREFSRLTLTVTDVRVQRLQEINEEDARAEGIRADAAGAGTYIGREGPGCWVTPWLTAVEAFSDLWNSLHGPDAWAANPWVAAYTFTVARRNIDEAQT